MPRRTVGEEAKRIAKAFAQQNPLVVQVKGFMEKPFCNIQDDKELTRWPSKASQKRFPEAF
jgi:hypothetical protein